MINWNKPTRIKGKNAETYDYVKNLGEFGNNFHAVVVRNIASGSEHLLTISSSGDDWLENVPEKPKEIWINIYSSLMANSAWCSMPYYSKEEAVIASKNVGSLLRISKFVEVKE